MKILLIGEYSHVHYSLSQALRALGHQVTLVSDGDGWKGYPRDIDITRRSTSPFHTLQYLWHLHRLWPRMRGYDVVQLVNPMFLELRAERIWPYYQQLRRCNGSVFLGAYGMDYYWAAAGCDCHTFRYSDFNIGSTLRHTPDTQLFVRDWLHGAKGELCRRIAHDVHGIVCGLYEYFAAYQAHFDEPQKLCFIPFPVECQSQEPSPQVPHPIRFFIGIQQSRNAYKGTDIMLQALERIEAEFPTRVEVRRAQDVPFAQYCQMLEGSDVLLDQLYSYTPAMNGLLAMSRGMVLVGGGEPEHYALLGEQSLRPIVNVEPTAQSVYTQLRHLVLHPECIPTLRQQSQEYVRRHHQPLAVAQRYVDFWQSRM